MNGFAAKLAAACLVLAALVAGTFYVRALRAELAAAEQQRDDARQGIAERDGTIEQMRLDAETKAKQQAQLDRTQGAIASKLNAVQLENRRLTDENAALRAWAGTPLPADVVRLQASPALTGADDYVEHVPGGEPVRAAGDGASHQR
ncbi:protein lysB [Burkholderia ubonensis]|uniref:Rz-like lysis system protein LysB n=1 Tax=Burkholderia ubonensis TaxID=101571 RepID=UPI00075BB00C|nr:Rz-like lysis system protein LysB [Burkholderia ubonensis]KWC22757.1 protein lysB [Burkholderia ubonensis]KWC34392.1 protein lysB [Burkholderia ubonensis]